MNRNSLYTNLAKYYDQIYSWKDYRAEAAKIKKLILKYKKSNGNKLLDVGCGTGNHLLFLKSFFSCTGIDTNKQILKIARKKVKKVKFKKADMTTLNINKKFDIIICLISTIGCLKNYFVLRKTIENFSKHLKIGGVLILEPWLAKSAFKDITPYLSTFNGKKLKIARMFISKIKGNFSISNDQFLIGEKGAIKQVVDKHKMMLFDADKTLSIIKQVGLKSKIIKSGLMKDRCLCVGIKV